MRFALALLILPLALAACSGGGGGDDVAEIPSVAPPGAPLNVQRCLDYVLSCCNESGLITSDQSNGPMYGHGFATLFLAEVVGMVHDRNLRDELWTKLRAAVR